LPAHTLGLLQLSAHGFLILDSKMKRVLYTAIVPFVVAFATWSPDARKIMEGVYKQDTSRDAKWRATLETIDRKGTVRRKNFSFSRLGSFGNSKTLVRFTDPAEVRGVGLLSINQGGANERQWMYTPAIQRVRRIAPQERGRRFLGSDFSNEDMSERVLEDFEYRLLGEHEVIAGRRTYKIEVKPVSTDRSQYRHIYVWVAEDIPAVVMAEYYNEDQQCVRIMKASRIEKTSDIWLARQIEMSTPAEMTRTVLIIEDVRFNTGLKEELFTQQALEKVDAH
jgi:hypothetical protein